MKYLILFEIIAWSVLSFQPIHASSRSSSTLFLQEMAQRRAQDDWDNYKEEIYNNIDIFKDFLETVDAGFYSDFKEDQFIFYCNSLKGKFLSDFPEKEKQDTASLGKALLVILASNNCKDDLSKQFLKKISLKKEEVLKSATDLLEKIKTDLTEDLGVYLSVSEIYNFIQNKGV